MLVVGVVNCVVARSGRRLQVLMCCMAVIRILDIPAMLKISKIEV
jgi:hypothetical protein